MNERAFLRMIQQRAARAAISASATRGQGAAGVVSCGRAFMSGIRLASFGTPDSKVYARRLDRATDQLMSVLPGSAASWGLSRKLLNIFLRDCLYTTFLAKAHGLHAAESLLEIPLDSITAASIRALVPDQVGAPTRRGARRAGPARRRACRQAREGTPLITRTTETTVRPSYSIIVPEDTVARAGDYLQALRVGRAQAGALLHDRLQAADLRAMTELELLGKLFDTKRPQIFAEMTVAGDGSDWSLTELGLLGDVSMAVPVTIFDDGNHKTPTPHAPPFSGMLIFTPGALLRNGRRHTPADWDEVTAPNGRLSTEGYYGLYRRRLLPVFRYINDHARKPRSAFVTVPGLGCGQFAGPFRGQLGARLQAVLQRLLTEYGGSFPNFKAVYFDPYSECENSRREIHGISFMVRPLRAPGNQAKSQLCRPVTYAEKTDDFSDCVLYSIVAWDHVSWPGNDFFVGSRATDDGVKAAATSSMSALTGVEGAYDPTCHKYQPPPPYACWEAVVDDGMSRGRLRLWNPLAVWRSVEAM
jgi:hypothetical protein